MTDLYGTPRITVESMLKSALDHLGQQSERIVAMTEQVVAMRELLQNMEAAAFGATEQAEVAPVATTHQEIDDAIERLTPQYLATYNAAKAELDAKRDEIQRQCGGIGHVYAKSRDFIGIGRGRECLFCHADEPKVEG